MRANDTIRPIPLAALASLSFGACADDATSDADLARASDRLVARLCDKALECEPEDFGSEFDNVQACREYYASYYSESYWTEFSAMQPDPEACREAAKDFIDCYTAFYANASCDEFVEFEVEPCPEEDGAFDRLCPEELDDEITEAP